MLTLSQFLRKSDKYNLIPIFEEIIIDIETPVSLYKKLSLENNYSFLLESVQDGRHSFIGLSPEKILKQYPDRLEVTVKNQTKNFTEIQLIDYVKDYLQGLKVMNDEQLPPFSGGFVGYFGYEMIRNWEELFHDQPGKVMETADDPMAILVMAKTIMVYDHLHNTVKIINNIKLSTEQTEAEKIRVYKKGVSVIKKIIRRIKQGKKSYQIPDSSQVFSGELKSNTSKAEFKRMVNLGKEHIRAGNVFQLVLSQKFTARCELPPFQIFRALRALNPSPYLFYLNFPEITILGSSPEVLVKVEGNQVITRPLAGTRPRGINKSEDLKFVRELQNDDKEKAEHIMLVDLGRNDLGRICQIGSIEITELMGVEYYSQVMHLVSQVEGKKRDDLDSLDVLKSVFPAGTVSGAPKIKAIEIINQLEKEPRGPYAGTVGYLDFNGNLDTCITIRTFVFKNGTLSVQAGAGIVADSIPEREYEETLNKARALFKALNLVRRDEIYDFGY